MKRGYGQALAFGVLAGTMLVFPQAAAEAAGEALGLWAGAVAPVLGPFLGCMLMLTSRMGGGPWLRLGLGWLCGSPGGARLMQPLGLRGKNALRYAAMTGTMSPMFFLGTVSGWLGSPEAGALILGCHVAGAAVTGLCIPREQAKASSAPICPLPLGAALRESALTLLGIALCMMLGSVAARMALCALPGLPLGLGVVLQCALEVTGGVRGVIGLPTPWTAPLVCAATSFGGLSLLLQNGACWQESGVGLGRLLALRLLHGALSGVLCLLLTIFFPPFGQKIPFPS